MLKLLILAFPDFSQPFEVTTDASNVAVGAVLSQQHHPIAFFSKKMSSRIAAASTYIREMYAITEAVKKWRQYLLGNTFKIFTDHKSLKNLMSQSIQTPEQQKWLAKLIGYNFEIVYKPGRENVVVDALSRVTESPLVDSFLTISAPSCPIVEQLKTFYSQHLAGQKLIRKLANDSTMQQQFTFRSGLLYFGDRLFVPKDTQLSHAILEEFHATPMGGHSGIKATLSRISPMFYWPGMHAEVKSYVNKCDVCQYSKYNTNAPYGLLQPLPTPRSRLGRHFNGFHHSSAQLIQQNSYLGGCRPLDKIWPLHRSPNQLFCSNSGCSFCC